MLRPTVGQTPRGLADRMGLSDEVHYSWRLLDPHSVTVGSAVKDGELSVYVQY